MCGVYGSVGQTKSSRYHLYKISQVRLLAVIVIFSVITYMFITNLITNTSKHEDTICIINFLFS